MKEHNDRDTLLTADGFTIGRYPHLIQWTCCVPRENGITRQTTSPNRLANVKVASDYSLGASCHFKWSPETRKGWSLRKWGTKEMTRRPRVSRAGMEKRGGIGCTTHTRPQSGDGWYRGKPRCLEPKGREFVRRRTRVAPLPTLGCQNDQKRRKTVTRDPVLAEAIRAVRRNLRRTRILQGTILEIASQPAVSQNNGQSVVDGVGDTPKETPQKIKKVSPMLRATTSPESSCETGCEAGDTNNQSPFVTGEATQLGELLSDEGSPSTKKWGFLSRNNWHSLALNLQRIRAEKEKEIGERERDETLLDNLDEMEAKICSLMFTRFQTYLGLDIGQSEFSKRGCDAAMEREFGSLNNNTVIGTLGPDDHESAAQLFSLYLSRKVWVPVPWREYESALPEFYQRVTQPVEWHSARPRVIAIGVAIVRAILEGVDRQPYEDREPNSDGACVELKKMSGGKRAALYYQPTEMKRLDKNAVKPTAIYTGGKIRVVTVDSYYNTRFAWLNGCVGDAFRELPCSIFGADAACWAERVRFDGPGDLVSGDLKAATDLLSGEFFEACLQAANIKLGLPFEDEELEQIKRFTTRATFKGKGGETKMQRRGQLMGSALSFPFLCVASLSAYIYSRPDLAYNLLWAHEDGVAKNILYSITDAGVNGDDVAFLSRSSNQSSLWEEGVAGLGGECSRGKTLVNGTYLTVNSELFKREGNKLVPVYVPRPSLLVAAGTGEIPTPARWEEYLRTTLLSDEGKIAMDLERVWKTHIPTQWGGSGRDLREWDMLSDVMKKELTNARLAARGTVLSPWKGSARGLQRMEELQTEWSNTGVMLIDATLKSAYQRIFGSRTCALWKDVVEKGVSRTLSRGAWQQACCDTEEEYSLILLLRSWKACVVRLPDLLDSQVGSRAARAFYAKDISEPWIKKKKLKSFTPLDEDVLKSKFEELLDNMERRYHYDFSSD